MWFVSPRRNRFTTCSIAKVESLRGSLGMLVMSERFGINCSMATFVFLKYRYIVSFVGMEILCRRSPSYMYRSLLRMITIVISFSPAKEQQKEFVSLNSIYIYIIHMIKNIHKHFSPCNLSVLYSIHRKYHRYSFT